MGAWFGTPLTRLSSRGTAAWCLLFALCAKGIWLYGSGHPARHELQVVDGQVAAVHLGGEGSATWLDVATQEGTARYGSWFGRDWPGMERIRPGDPVELLVERNRLAGKGRARTAPYYFWQLVHEGRVVVDYATVRELVTSKEAVASRWIDAWLVAALIWAVVAWGAHWRLWR